MANIERHSVDIVVVGCGIAGLSAAVSALEAGRSVAILERASPEERGGQTRWTEAGMRMKNEDEVADDFEAHFAENSGHYLDPRLINEAAGAYESWSPIVKTLNFTDPEIISTLSERAGATLRWLKGYGVRFMPFENYFITQSTSRIQPVGGGLALVEALATEAEKRGAAFHYRTTARSLLQGPDGRVAGIHAVGPDRQAIVFDAHSVILASGGFEGNAEMLVQYLGPRARYMRPVARGGYYNKGEGIRMALAIGAAPAGDFSQVHAEPLDPRSGAPEPIVLVFNYGLLVNKRGERFIDEAPASVDATYEAITRRILDEPEGIAYAVTGGDLDDVPNWRRSVRSDEQPITAGSLAELAAKIGVPPEALEKTVADYNAACADEATVRKTFRPLEPDGLGTRPGYFPRKSNWARPLRSGPYRAIPMICGNCFTFGGIKVNTRSQVVDADGKAIPGLYAAGEMTGLYYGTYTGATSVLRGAVFGRIAGQHAAGQG